MDFRSFIRLVRKTPKKLRKSLTYFIFLVIKNITRLIIIGERLPKLNPLPKFYSPFYNP